jgi:riboflavin biosynthesis pyrimidine reductase
MNRPYVICHMASTVDGRIIGEHWGGNHENYSALYEQCHNSFESQAWMVGRVTMEKDFTEGRKPKLKKPGKPIVRTHYVGHANASFFAIAVDPSGKLGWDTNDIDGDHVIEIVTEKVDDDYLQHLQDKQVSYIFAGKDNINFKSALEQLHAVFGIKTLMLEGGGHINGSLLNAGLIDELSLIILPLADGTPKTPTTFEVSEYLPKNEASKLKLTDVKRLEHDVVWLRYHVKADRQ